QAPRLGEEPLAVDQRDRHHVRAVEPRAARVGALEVLALVLGERRRGGPAARPYPLVAPAVHRERPRVVGEVRPLERLALACPRDLRPGLAGVLRLEEAALEP